MELKIHTKSVKETKHTQVMIMYWSLLNRSNLEIQVLSYMLTHSTGNMYIAKPGYQKEMSKLFKKPWSGVNKAVERLRQKGIIIFNARNVSRIGGGCYTFHLYFDQLTDNPDSIKLLFDC